MKIRKAQSTSKNQAQWWFNMDRSADTCWPYSWVLLLLYSGSVLLSLHTQTWKLKCLHLQSYHWISCKCGHICLLGINDPSCMCPCHVSRWGGGQGPRGLVQGPNKEGLCLLQPLSTISCHLRLSDTCLLPQSLWLLYKPEAEYPCNYSMCDHNFLFLCSLLASAFDTDWTWLKWLRGPQVPGLVFVYVCS